MDGSFIDYLYDGRNRLTEITDNLDNRIEYLLDSEGNRLAENTYDPDDTLARTMSREYNAISQIQTSLNAQSEATTYGYDAAGNQLSSADPLAVETQQQYDALNRLIKTVQDTGGIEAETQFTYDAAGNLTEVIDPKGLSTGYTYDARGNLTALDSPDTGVAAYEYDSADNRIRQTDARGVTVDYRYDALNRLTDIEYPDSSLDVTFFYDEADSTTNCPDSYPAGRLTRMTDASGMTIYCYDHRGNVTQKTQVMDNGAVNLTVSYEYDLADRLAAITYPSGKRMGYGRDAAGRLNNIGADNTDPGPPDSRLGLPIPYVEAFEYLPFGPVSQYILAQSQVVTRSHDQNYWLTDVESPALNLHFERDAVGNIKHLDNSSRDSSDSQNVQQYEYDNLYRLTDVQRTNGTLIEGYSYDETGNRLSKTVSGSATPYTYPADSHRLTEVDSQARNYDAVGNMLTDAANNHGYTYGDHNRLSAFSRPGGTWNYHYNGRGERVHKKTGLVIGTGTHVLFVYDEAGRLLGEYDADGVVKQEYVYADDLPVLILPPSGIHYIHADHLGTPRAVTDNGGTKRWEWPFHSNPFGEQPPNEDPEKTGTSYTLNLRFPGQYYDAESGLHYNYFRDYEPGTGRYVQSDPIGLRGGLNTFGYASQNPIMSFDRYGLFPFDKGFDPNICVGLSCICTITGTFCPGEPVPAPRLVATVLEEIGCYECEARCVVENLLGVDTALINGLEIGLKQAAKRTAILAAQIGAQVVQRVNLITTTYGLLVTADCIGNCN